VTRDKPALTIKRTFKGDTQEVALVLGGALAADAAEVNPALDETVSNTEEIAVLTFGKPVTVGADEVNPAFDEPESNTEDGADVPGRPGKDEEKLPRLVAPGTVPPWVEPPGPVAPARTVVSKLSRPDSNSLNASTSTRN
jgi:hypothetical protein